MVLSLPNCARALNSEEWRSWIPGWMVASGFWSGLLWPPYPLAVDSGALSPGMAGLNGVWFSPLQIATAWYRRSVGASSCVFASRVVRTC